VRVGIISGTGTTQWPELERAEVREVMTPYGAVEMTLGRFAGVDVAHVSRHGPGHVRVSNHVEHRGNLAALRQAEVDCLVSLTVCGAMRAELPLGSLVVFDDFYFPSNRLPDGSLCTWYGEAGQPGRGHWIFDHPFSPSLRASLIEGAEKLQAPVQDSGCYGHVDGPRFNSRSEIAAMRSAGVSAVSQTAGPEVVLAGEVCLPMALVGYLTDYANGVHEVSEPVEALLGRIAASTETFAAVLEVALPTIREVTPAGIVHRFEP
jgi:5'-methylthioadenosine phosphorylase